jgi:chromosome segregation ATPase
VIALLYIMLELFRQWWNSGKQKAETRKTQVETDAVTANTKKTLAELVDELVEHRKDDRAEIDSLQKRVDVLEVQLETKEATIKQKDCDIEKLTAQVNRLDARLTKVLIYVSGLLRELDAKGVQYTKPEPGVLDTDPNIKAIRK